MRDRVAIRAAVENSHEEAVLVYTEPCAAGSQVSAGEDLWFPVGEIRFGGRPVVMLVAIGRNQQRSAVKKAKTKR